MYFEQNATLIGVVGKKGTGTLDNGNVWSTDRVELHLITPFLSTDTMAHGSTVTVVQVEDYAANYESAVALIDQEIVLQMVMVPSKKLGQPPRMICESFKAKNPLTKKNSPHLGAINNSAVAV